MGSSTTVAFQRECDKWPMAIQRKTSRETSEQKRSPRGGYLSGGQLALLYMQRISWIPTLKRSLDQTHLLSSSDDIHQTGQNQYLRAGAAVPR